MSNQSVCAGCYINSSLLYHPHDYWKYGPYHYPHMDYYREHISLTQDESDILTKLAELCDKFNKLECKHDDDNRDFLDAIHKAQRLIALRVARRANPEIWKQHNGQNSV